MVFIYNGIIFSPKEEYLVMCKQMDGTGEHHLK
jgi:hypothetical protein